MKTQKLLYNILLIITLTIFGISALSLCFTPFLLLNGIDTYLMVTGSLLVPFTISRYILHLFSDEK